MRIENLNLRLLRVAPGLVYWSFLNTMYISGPYVLLINLSQELCSSFPGRKFLLEYPTFIALYYMLTPIFRESQISLIKSVEDAYSTI